MRTELVTTLKRQATEILNQLEKDREPILITQHGVPSAYLVDVETFENLQRRMTLLEGIALGTYWEIGLRQPLPSRKCYFSITLCELNSLPH